MTKREDITIINYAELSEREGWDKLDYEHECAMLEEWCREHKVSYYGAPKDCCSVEDAIDLAIEEGNTAVVIDNLS